MAAVKGKSGLLVLVSFLALFVGCQGGSQTGLAPIQPDVSPPPPRVILEYPSDRALIDAFQIIAHPDTGKVEAARLRNALIHWDVTQDILYDPPPGYPPDLCTECSELTLSPIDARNSFLMTLELRNHSLYDGRDVRAILIEDSTNPHSLEMRFPDDYSDIWAENHGDIDLGTNPFIAYRKEAPDRKFDFGEEESQSKWIIVNLDTATSTNEVKGLLIIDACWYPGDPNCKEPYSIEFPDQTDQYLNLFPQGTYEADITIQAFDHQGNYGDLQAVLFFEDIGDVFLGTQNPPDSGIFDFNIEFDPEVVRGGTHEGLITVTDTSIGGGAAVQSLKEKMWVTVNPVPDAVDYPSEGIIQARFISPPARVNLDDDAFLETVYTADNRVHVIDEEGLDTLVLGGGCFIGTPTFMNLDPHPGVEIIFTNDPMNGGARMVYVYSHDDFFGFQFVWSYELPGNSPPVGQPVPLYVSGENQVILVLCQDGRKVLLRGDPASINREIYNTNSADTYMGAPAIYQHDPGNPYAAFVKHDSLGVCKLEIFKVLFFGAPALYAEVEIPDVWQFSRPTPAVDFGNYEYGVPSWQIFVPCMNYVVRIRDAGGAVLVNEWEANGWGNNEFSQIALGDMNHNGIPDVVVPFGGKMRAFEGSNGAEIWNHSIFGKNYKFNSPSMIDFNDDGYLDVVTGIYPISGGLPRLVVIDGSPFNNHNRLDSDDRLLWQWNPGVNYRVMGQQPCFTRTTDGLLRIGMTFKENDYGIDGPYLYQAILTNVDFGFNGEENRKPWPKAFFNWWAWNNYLHFHLLQEGE